MVKLQIQSPQFKQLNNLISESSALDRQINKAHREIRETLVLYSMCAVKR